MCYRFVKLQNYQNLIKIMFKNFFRSRFGEKLSNMGKLALGYCASHPYISLSFIMFSNLVGVSYYFGQDQFEMVSKKISREIERFSQIEYPVFARKFIYTTYGKWYGVNFTELVDQLDQFRTFSDFFCRRVKPRKIDLSDEKISSPCDSKILNISQITSDKCMIIKNIQYSLGQLLTGQKVTLTKQQIQELKKNKQNKLYQVIFYLSPGDYHRYHSPANFQVVNRQYFQGILLPVHEKQLLKNKKVYQKNQRKFLEGRYFGGYMNMIMIGALNVGKILIHKKNNYVKGEQVGMFKLGSTIVLIFESNDKINWLVKQGQKIRYGQTICQLVP